MATIISRNNCLAVGSDFVDAVKAAETFNGLQYQGRITATKDKRTFIDRQWFSRLETASEAERVIRKACNDEGYAVVSFVWQKA